MGQKGNKSIRERHSSWRWKDKLFRLRLALAFILVPPSGPLCFLLLTIRNAHAMSFGDWAGIVLLYTIFGFAAMVVFGIPLVYLYSRLNWTGFPSFIIGGTLCASLTQALVMRGQVTSEFAFFGVIEGLSFV